MREATEAEKLRFGRITAEAAAEEKNCCGIGTYGEKMLHSILKSFVCEDKSCHEKKIIPDAPDKTGARETGYIADVVHGGVIYEIQTGSFYPLFGKIKYYLENTDFNITVVCPVAARKWITWIEPTTGETGKRSLSPKKGSELDVLPELFWLAPYLNSSRLCIRVMLLGIEEFRLKNGWGNGGKRGSKRYERIPTELIGIYEFSAPADYMRLLPAELPEFFTAAEFGKLMKMKGRKIYSALKVYIAVGLFAAAGREGRAVRYKKK